MIIAATLVLALVSHLVVSQAFDVGVTAAMTAACIAGALTGVRFAGRVPQRQLGAGFTALVLLVASYLLVSLAFLDGPPGA